MQFKDLVNIFFFKKQNWNIVTDADKDSLFFIFNRYMSQKYPKQAQYFNKKDIDKATALDYWFFYLKKEYKMPTDFWKRKTKRQEPIIKEWKILADFFKISLNDIYILCELFPEDVKSEIERLKLINENI